jgi:hypothetical protein
LETGESVNGVVGESLIQQTVKLGVSTLQRRGSSASKAANLR